MMSVLDTNREQRRENVNPVRENASTRKLNDAREEDLIHPLRARHANIELDVGSVHKSHINGTSDVGSCEDQHISTSAELINLRKHGVDHLFHVSDRATQGAS